MKKARLLLLLIALHILNVAGACAQRGVCDILILKNGTQIRGRLNVKNDSMVCIASGRNLLCYPTNQIKSLGQEKANMVLPWDTCFSRGFYSQASFGIMSGDGVAGTYIPVSFEYSFMWQLSRYYALGLQTGLETYEYLTVPFMLKNVLAFNTGRNSPYTYICGGFGFPFGAKSGSERDRYLSGTAFEIGLGYRKPIRDCLDFTFSVGYRYQKLSSEKENSGWGGGTYITDFEYNRVILRFGLSIW